MISVNVEEIMTTEQITLQLNLSEIQEIKELAQIKGKNIEELIQEAIAQFLIQHRLEHRLDLLRQACGMWQDHHDLPDISELRQKWNRF
jgi:hypothetical protein